MISWFRNKVLHALTICGLITSLAAPIPGYTWDNYGANYEEECCPTSGRRQGCCWNGCDWAKLGAAALVGAGAGALAARSRRGHTGPAGPAGAAGPTGIQGPAGLDAPPPAIAGSATFVVDATVASPAEGGGGILQPFLSVPGGATLLLAPIIVPSGNSVIAEQTFFLADAPDGTYDIGFQAVSGDFNGTLTVQGEVTLLPIGGGPAIFSGVIGPGIVILTPDFTEAAVSLTLP